MFNQHLVTSTLVTDRRARLTTIAASRRLVRETTVHHVRPTVQSARRLHAVAAASTTSVPTSAQDARVA